MKRTLTAICLFFWLTATVSAGHVCNKNGAVVTMSDGTVLYLGKSCDAAREGGGTGKWWNAASFLGVQIGDQAYMVREELDCLPFCQTQ